MARMRVLDHYLFRQLGLATVFVAVTLTAVILLTQSLRFLELVMNSGASATVFWLLTLLALPRFFEIILPISLMAGILFVYHRMAADSELVVMRAAGFSPSRLARPALWISLGVMAFLLVVTSWLAPLALGQMQYLRQVVKAQVSTLLFREGVFNAAGAGLTVYIRERDAEGGLHGIVIHDTRTNPAIPVTVMARRGAVVAAPGGNQVVVFDGSRQTIHPTTGMLERLDFSRYTIELPEDDNSIRPRWREPDERTLPELLRPDPGDERARESRREFRVEANRRLISPLLAPALAVIALSLLLVGPQERRGQTHRILAAVLAAIAIEGLYVAAFSLARTSDVGLVLMYVLVLGPLAAGGVVLSSVAERFLSGKRKGVA